MSAVVSNSYTSGCVKALDLKSKPEEVFNVNPSAYVISNILVPTLLATAFVLFEYATYIVAKKRGHRLTCRDAIRFQISLLETTLKSGIIDFARIFLLVAVMALPLIVLSLTTEYSVLLLMTSSLGMAWSPFPISAEVVISFLFLLTDLVAVQYFFGKYGAIYKLVVAFHRRDDIKQLLGKHRNALEDILMGLGYGTVIYAVVLLTFLVSLISSYTALSEIATGIVIMLLLGYVLPNNKYENAIRLIERIWR